MASEIANEINRLRETIRDVFGYGSDSIRYKMDELIDEVRSLREEVKKLRESLERE